MMLKEMIIMIAWNLLVGQEILLVRMHILQQAQKQLAVRLLPCLEISSEFTYDPHFYQFNMLIVCNCSKVLCVIFWLNVIFW